MFLCIRPSVSEKIISYFSYIKKQCFSMYFDFIKQFIKVKRILAKISKNNKNFILSVS